MKTLKAAPTLLSLVLIAALAAGIAGCDRPQHHTGSPLRYWAPVEPEADSIMAILDARMEDAAINDAADDSILINRLFSIADSVGSDHIRARAMYYQGSDLASGQMTQEGLDMIGEALTLIDSVAYPYDAARFHSMASLYYPRAIRSLINLHSADAFLAAGDSAKYASTCNKIAIDRDAIGDTINAIRYYDEAIRTAKHTGKHLLATIAAYNKLTLINGSRPTQAPAMVDSMMRDSFTMANIQSLPSLLIIAYQYDNNVRHLQRGHEVFPDNKTYQPVKAIYEAYLADYHMRRGPAGRDSMDYYRRLCLSRIDDDCIAAEEVFTILADLYKAIGQEDSARMYQEKVDHFHDIRYARSSSRMMENDLVRHELDLRDAEYQAEMRRHRTQRNVLISVIAAIVALGGGAALWLARHRRTERRQIDTVGAIRSRISGQSNWTDVERAFAEVEPDWTARLKKRWPTLTPGDVRMACLCYINLDTKQIARILSIAPDSAKKNRQRLRAKLSLSPGRHLRDLLADI
ncbi:MAG: hypothetical protein NC187_00630 [Candidatus Amulumruptor caecigallinarius]|nr:hypothetical protein [Candidatus Amulumruptor caecigallinarius]MCM1395981.1 hypothetical protein [Candidatus Amulumruptor caecigallinarius]MCM1453013.1 hypothetical protein [bacterium]